MKPAGDQECMAFSIRMCRIVGCWPYFRDKNKPSEHLYYLYTTTMVSILVVYVVILAYGLTVHYKKWKSLEEAIEELIVFATGVIVLFKVALIILNQKRLQEIIDYINNDLNVREIIEDEDRLVVTKCLKHERSLTKTFVTLGYCITTLYTTSSIIRILKERSAESEHYTWPLKYPYYLKEFPMYHLTYVHQMLVMIFNGHIGTLTDTFFSCLTFYVCGHFKVAKNRIERDGGVITKNFVSYHNEIMRLVSSLQSIYGSFLTFQLTTNSLLLCLGLLQITQTVNIKPIHYLKCLIYVTYKLSQMFLYCWYGQEIIQTSLAVSSGAYSGRWYEIKSRTNSNNLKIVLLRTQKPVKFKAGIYFVLSLPTLATVMNTAYSFFTMVKSIQ